MYTLEFSVPYTRYPSAANQIILHKPSKPLYSCVYLYLCETMNFLFPHIYMILPVALASVLFYLLAIATSWWISFGVLLFSLYSVVGHANFVIFAIPFLGIPTPRDCLICFVLGGMLLGALTGVIADAMEYYPPPKRLRTFLLRLSERLSCTTPIPSCLVYFLGVFDLFIIPAAISMIILGALKNPAPKPGAIIMLHGNGMNSGQWVIGRIHLALHGIGPVVCPNYLNAPLRIGPVKGGAAECTERILHHILPSKTHISEGPRAVIGHSLGGIVYSATVTPEAPQENVVKIFMSCPWMGSDLLNWIHKTLPPSLTRMMTLATDQLIDLLPENRWNDPHTKEQHGMVASYWFTGALDVLVRPTTAMPPGCLEPSDECRNEDLKRAGTEQQQQAPQSEGNDSKPLLIESLSPPDSPRQRSKHAYVYPHLGHYTICTSRAFWGDVVGVLREHGI